MLCGGTQQTQAMMEFVHHTLPNMNNNHFISYSSEHVIFNDALLAIKYRSVSFISHSTAPSVQPASQPSYEEKAEEKRRIIDLQDEKNPIIGPYSFMPWISFPSHRPGTSSLVCWWHLREGVGPGAPPGQKQRQANRLEDLGRSADGNGVDGALLGENLVEVLGIV